MLPALRGGLGIARLADFIIDRKLAEGSADWSPMNIALHLLTLTQHLAPGAGGNGDRLPVRPLP